MFDQSFSRKNLQRIVNYENRKGIYLEKDFFPDAAAVSKQIVELNREIKAQKNLLSKQAFSDYFKEKIRIKDTLLDARNNLINVHLDKISNLILDNQLNLQLIKGSASNSKEIYMVKRSPEAYLALKYIQHSMRRLYKVKQKNRDLIINQIVSNFKENHYPAVIVRTDIKDFYESMDPNFILEKINRENLLLPSAKQIINKVLRGEYMVKHGNTKGIPRGLGISAYLAEIYLSDIDLIFKAHPSVLYYARFVDDIFLVLKRENDIIPATALKFATDTISKFGLAVNTTKTISFEVSKAVPKLQKTDYLGYQLAFKSNLGCNVDLSKKRTRRLLNKIRRSFIAYHVGAKKDECKARKMLRKRIKFLTTNTRLHNRKQNVLIGIYFSNKFINQDVNLKYLDRYLQYQIRKSNYAGRLTSLLQFSFLNGFKRKIYSRYSPNDLKSVMKAWEYV